MQVGQPLRLIAADEIDDLRSDAKYTRVASRGEAGAGRGIDRHAAEGDRRAARSGAVRAVHRSVVVNLRAIGHVARGGGDDAVIHLKGRTEMLPVSRCRLHLFRQM